MKPKIPELCFYQHVSLCTKGQHVAASAGRRRSSVGWSICGLDAAVNAPEVSVVSFSLAKERGQDITCRAPKYFCNPQE
eukprot:6191851-Pleurochrysis_carterae.AAC.2